MEHMQNRGSNIKKKGPPLNGYNIVEIQYLSSEKHKMYLSNKIVCSHRSVSTQSCTYNKMYNSCCRLVLAVCLNKDIVFKL